MIVEELPESCWRCPCFIGITCRCKLLHKYLDECGEVVPKHCPLQSLADYTKQVRKEVCEEITKFFRKNFTAEINKKGNFLIRVEQDKFNKLLDQIQGKGE